MIYGIDIALTAYNYSRICHIYNIYSGINRGVNKKEGVILRWFNIYNILIFVTGLYRISFRQGGVENFAYTFTVAWGTPVNLLVDPDTNM